MFSCTCWFTYCWYHTKLKHQIYNTLGFLVLFKVEEVNIKISSKKKSFVKKVLLTVALSERIFFKKGFTYV